MSMNRGLFEYPYSPFTKLKRTDRIFLQEINDGCILVEREGIFYKHRLSDDALGTLLMVLNGEIVHYHRGEKQRYDPE